MDHRIALSPETTLHFNTDAIYTIRGETGRGGSCIVYDSSYRTNAGDEKTVRIRECYPYGAGLKRDKDGRLLCESDGNKIFEEAKARMYRDFRVCNQLFYAEETSDAIINPLNIYEANNTVYIVTLWSRENALQNTVIENLRKCLSIVRQTAAAINSIHSAGFLYLDIKPENIAVINSSSGRVQLFDFDSLFPISAIWDPDPFTRYRLSYTKGFAAMELRRGQISSLGKHTDVYGIGALLFYLLFGRTPDAPDCNRSAKYDFTRILYPRSYPDRLFVQLTDFFHRSLAAFPLDRFQTMTEMLKELESIEALANPAYPYLVTSSFGTPERMIGREAEIEALDRSCKEHTDGTLFISGMGGIGKSTLVRHYLSLHHEEWDSIAYLFFNNSLRRTILNDDMLRINGTEQMPEEKETEYFQRKLRKLRDIVHRDRVLLVIDNFEDIRDPDLDRILTLGCKTLIITRLDPGSLNLPVMKIGPLSKTDELIQLFVLYLNRDVSEEERSILNHIITTLSGHTLAIELFARQISNCFLTLPDALEMLQKHGILHIGTVPVDYQRDDSILYEQTETIITQLFESNSLSSVQISILKALALFPAQGIEAKKLMDLADIKSVEQLYLPVHNGWISRNVNVISLHPLIRDVVRNIPLTAENSRHLTKTLNNLCSAILEESNIEEINISPTVLAPVLAEKLSRFSPADFITNHRKLQEILSTTRDVLDSLRYDSLWDTLEVQKLAQAFVINLPKYEDELILSYGKKLLEAPAHLTPLEIIQTVDAVNSILLERQEYDEAIHLIEFAESYAVDERTKAEYYGLLGAFHDTRDFQGDREKSFKAIINGIEHARKAAPPKRRHLLAEFLLGKMNAITRREFGNLDEFDNLFREISQIIDNECLPYSEIRHGFAIAMGFFWGEVCNDSQQTEQWIGMARSVAEKRWPIGLDYIDKMIIPPAIIYIDLKDFCSCEAILMEGVRICDEYPDFPAYLRKKHDLHRYLLDVYLEGNEPDKARAMIKILDEECEIYDFPDTVFPEIRQYLS